MTVHYTDESVTLHHGDCLDVLRELPDASVDAVVTDPPYGISFMGKQWDQPGANGSQHRGGSDRPFTAGPVGVDHLTTTERSASMHAGKYDLTPSAMQSFQRWCTEWAAECLRVLKPGGHLLSFGGSRTWHRLAAAVEDAGFEIRDSIAWLYGSGFPKSRNLDGDWQGWGTALKPSFEPIVVGRKPLAGTVAGNVLLHSTGALNVDACRVGSDERTNNAGGVSSLQRISRVEGGYRPTVTESAGVESSVTGRWPTNVLLDEDQAADLDAQTGVLTSGKMQPTRTDAGREVFGQNASGGYTTMETYGDSGGASRFFPVFRYEAKAPSSERPRVAGVSHPTVKPLALMRWLIRLVTPPGGTVLEPFAGSGTTVEACIQEGMRCIAIERGAEYLPLIQSRIDRHRNLPEHLRATGAQMGLFGLIEGAS